MSITITGQRLRMKVDAAKPTELFNIADGATPLLFTANDVRIELGFFFNSLWVDDASNITSIQVEVWRVSSGALLIDETTTTVENAPTEANWDAGTDQHVVIELAAADTNFDFDGATAEPCLIEITALLSNGKVITLAKAPLNICDTLHGVGDPTELPEPTYYTAAQALALFQKNAPTTTAENLTIKASDGNRYLLGVTVVDSVPTLSLEQVAE